LPVRGFQITAPPHSADRPATARPRSAHAPQPRTANRGSVTPEL
jgi:hypothetical protein